jgi:pSer/pThr/pTyr-binding forkhead associated (FHA) protein
LGSKTGTKVNGQVISEWALQPGDVIEIGSNTFIYGEGLDAKKTKLGRDAGIGDGTLAIPREETL